MTQEPKKECAHKDSRSYVDLETEDHIVVCRDCRSVIHWCNDIEDQWEDLETHRGHLDINA